MDLHLAEEALLTVAELQPPGNKTSFKYRTKFSVVGVAAPRERKMRQFSQNITENDIFK